MLAVPQFRRLATHMPAGALSVPGRGGRGKHMDLHLREARRAEARSRFQKPCLACRAFGETYANVFLRHDSTRFWLINEACVESDGR